MKNYSIGLDIGTTSVGWAIVDNNTFKLVKKGNKRQSMWGVRLFDEAISAEGRRNSRSTRRRYERRRQRIKLLQEIFKDEIEKIDNEFFDKLHDSFYSANDKNNKKVLLTDYDKINIFGNNSRKLSKKKYPTIYHVRNKIINSTEKEDIRLIYLAIHHIIKYRGNFLYSSDNFSVNNLNIKEKLQETFTEINSLCKEINFNYDEINDSLYEKLEQTLLEKSINDKKVLTKELLVNYFNKDFVSEFIKLILGNQFNISKLFNIELEEEIKLSFKGTDYEDKYFELEKALEDKISVLKLLKELYDMLFLKNLFGNSSETNISSLMINRYNKHHLDLIFLKKLLKYDKKIYKEFFKDKYKDTPNEELCIYSKYINNKITYDEFINKLNKALEKIFGNNISLELKEEYIKVKTDIENGLFLPKITNTDNGKYPYQLNKDELIKIIDSQGKYYDFLNEKVIINGKPKYKLVQLLEFKIPYYVGPLNTNTNKKDVSNKNAWLIKKDDYTKITPYNFDEVIDKEQTAEQFITRMISNCTYILNEKAMPSNSILYSKYKVLNELKQIKINNIKLPIDLQHTIYEELFLTTNKTITEKIFIDFIKKTNEYSMYKDLLVEGYSDDKKFANSMKSYYDFFGENGIFNNTNYNIEDAEEIIKWITIFEDKDILEQKVRKNYPKLSESQIKQVITKKYSGWSNLSKKLLTEIVYKDKITGNPKSIMDLMWETNENFMQIMFNKAYNFQDKINKLNAVKNTNRINYSLVENLATSPATKRGIYQALKLVEELVDYMGYNPKNIMIEMARGEEKKQRKDNRKEYLRKIYLENKKDIDNYNYLQNELDSKEKINTEKLFLYFIQLGKSMYSNKPLDINNLDLYEVDHIIPRTLIKDDSLDNKVLVLKEENQEKAASFVLPKHFRTNEMIQWWRHLKDLNLISSKKFNNLCRDYYSPKDIEGFINRQLVETRQITKHVANILNSFYNDTNIIYLHASLSSNYREKYELFKYRELNDFHHAHDAYLTSVLGVYQKEYLNKSTDFNKLKEISKKLYDENRYNDLKYGYVINSIDNEVSTFDENTGEITFDADNFNNVIKNTLYQNDILISKKTEIKTGKFYKETIYKKGDKKSKFKIKENLDNQLYGGYNETTYSYMKLIEYQNKKKTIRTLIYIPLPLENKKNKESLIDNYIKTSLGISKYIIKKDKMPFNLLINYKNQNCLITGSGELANAREFVLTKKEQIKYKYLLNYIFNNKYPNKEKYLIENNLTNVDNETYKKYYYDYFDNQINELFDFIIDYIKNNYPLYESISNKLNLVKESNEFYYLTLEDKADKNSISKVDVIKQLFIMLKCNSTNANLEKLNGTTKFSSRVGRLSGVNVTTATIINKSITGLKERKYEF